MSAKWRDWRVLGAGVSALVFALVFTWLSVFAGAGYDGDGTPPLLPRILIAAGIAGPVLPGFALANLGKLRRGGAGFDVVRKAEPLDPGKP